ncbi:MAG: TIGR04086 family membrane protein [Halanaerobiales bacterium]
MFDNNKEKFINSFVIFKGVILGLLIILILTVIFALFSGILFRLEEAQLSKVFLVKNIILLLIIGFYVAKNVERNGWLNGAVAGLIFMLVLILLGSISVPLSFTNVIFMAFLGLILGSIGGILGINL